MLYVFFYKSSQIYGTETKKNDSYLGSEGVVPNLKKTKQLHVCICIIMYHALFVTFSCTLLYFVH